MGRETARLTAAAEEARSALASAEVKAARLATAAEDAQKEYLPQHKKYIPLSQAADEAAEALKKDPSNAELRKAKKETQEAAEGQRLVKESFARQWFAANSAYDEAAREVKQLAKASAAADTALETFLAKKAKTNKKLHSAKMKVTKLFSKS